MSAWSEAIWIIKKIQKGFNTINNNINNLATKIDDSTGSQTAPFVDEITQDSQGNNVPKSNPSGSWTNGTIWLISEGEDTDGNN